MNEVRSDDHHPRGPVEPEANRWRAVIPRVPGGERRPLWSVMIPTYHCAEHLRYTLASVLAQDPGPERMQIEVVDDASTRDDPGVVVEGLGAGRVRFFRQSRNVGITENFATCLTRARGELVHLLHGDDYVRPGFYVAMQRAFEERPEVGAAFCRQIFADSKGRWMGISPIEQDESGVMRDAAVRLALEQRVMTPSIVVRRSVYEELGGFDRRLRCSEDWEMWVRIAARHPVWYEAEPLAVYRMHAGSNTGRHTSSAEDVRYTREAIRIFTDYLPPTVAREVSQRARRTYALAALRTARTLCRRGDRGGASRQLHEALRLSRAPAVVRGAAGVALRMALAAARAPRAGTDA